METDELKKIKKMYGENFMKMCRSLFSTLLEREGVLYEILSSCFSKNCKTLYEDIKREPFLEEDFINYIYSKVDGETTENKILTDKTPYELLEEAGYYLTECKTEEEIQKFKKYYKPEEELCTFRGGRLDRCVVFWAIKKNVEDIKREDFPNPRREDEYGTSVIGIQFEKKGICTVSIKNRYNHRVNNSDATYGNDLDRIIPGLTESFSRLIGKEYGLELNNINIEKFEIPGYTVANDGKYYKYNMEINGIYYCPGNIIIKNGEPYELKNPESQMLIDYFILDTKNKTICLYDSTIIDSFIDTFQDLAQTNAKIKIERNKEKRIKVITIQKSPDDSIIIETDKNNQIIGYNNQELKKVGDNFLSFNKALGRIELPKLMKVENNFLNDNRRLAVMVLPNLIEAGNNFLNNNEDMYYGGIELPRLMKVGDFFFSRLSAVGRLELPNLVEVGNNFLCYAKMYNKVELPKLKKVGDKFLYSNQSSELKFPNLEKAGYGFLATNKILTLLELPKLPELKEKFSPIIEENVQLQEKVNRQIQEERNREIINSQSIVKLDRDNNLTTSEINIGAQIIEENTRTISQNEIEGCDNNGK